MLTAHLVRDLLTVMLLIMALVLPWNYDGPGAQSTWVVLSVLLALAGLGATYALRPSVIGASVPVEQIAIIRRASAIPLILVIIVTLVQGLAQEQGIGIAVAAGAAAVVFIAQHQAGRATSAAGWTLAAGALYVAAGVWVLVSLLSVLRGNLTSLLGWGMILPFASVGIIVVLVGVGLLRGSAPQWAGGLAFVGMLLLAFLAVADALGGASTYIAARVAAEPTVGGLMTLTLMAAAASLGPGVYGTLTPAMRGANRWIQAAIGLVGLATILAAASFTQMLLVVIETQRSGVSVSVDAVLVMVLALLLTAALVVCRARLIAAPALGRRLTVWLMAASGVLALVLYAATSTELNPYVLTLYFLIPGAVSALLTIPADVREKYGPIIPAS